CGFAAATAYSLLPTAFFSASLLLSWHYCLLPSFHSSFFSLHFSLPPPAARVLSSAKIKKEEGFLSETPFLV
ncbi:MAG: hypothetical protein IKR48_11610, partial [Kiritimatiellae bacterium]|nr:hypothetical protein [Kiritimatiellia bacterium]